VDAVVNMVDVMRARKTPIATICLGKAMSCGAVLLTQGTEGQRFMAPSSRVMIHEVAAGTGGKVEEIKADSAEFDRLNKMIFKWMSNNTQHHDDYFSKIVHDKSHADWYLTADDCKTHNIVNHVRIPKFNISVKMEINFE
jgi:ATP-dependent Clp protease protease subunit